MNIGRLGGVMLALAVACLNHAAYATTWVVLCNGAGVDGGTVLEQLTGGLGSDVAVSATFPADSVAGIAGQGAATGAPDALGALLGTPKQGPEILPAVSVSGGLTFGESTIGPYTASLAAGDTIQIISHCNQVVDLRTSFLQFVGNTGTTSVADEPPGTAPPDGISNQFLIDGAQNVILNSLTFGPTSGQVNIAANTSLDGGFAFAGEGLLCVVDGADVVLENSEVENSSGRGIYVTDSSSVALLATIVTNNGTGNTDQTENTGVFAENGAAVKLGSITTAKETSTVTLNAGDGIRAVSGSSLTILAATINGNLQKQIYLLGSSSGKLDGENAANQIAISAPSGDADDAVAIEAGSSLLIENDASVIGSATGLTIAVSGSSTLLLQGSLVSGGTITIEGSGGSLIALAGGNSICNGALTPPTAGSAGSCALPSPYPTTDAAIEIDHVAALNDIGAISGLNFPAVTGTTTPAVPDIITGNGILQLQSTADLGEGLIGSTASLQWTTGSTGIAVAQNSSVRLEGGAAITGTVFLRQGANGFVNASKIAGFVSGTSPPANTVSGGIECPFTTVPDSHLVFSPGTLSPVPTELTSYVPVSPATAFTTEQKTQCLPF